MLFIDLFRLTGFPGQNADILILKGGVGWHVRFRNSHTQYVFQNIRSGYKNRLSAQFWISAGQIQIRCIVFSMVTYVTKNLSHVSQWKILRIHGKFIIFGH